MLFFYINSCLTLIFTALTVIAKNPIHALLFFTASLISLSFNIYYLGSPFSAILLIIVYAGAIIILFLFVLMVFNLRGHLENNKIFLPVIVISILIAELVYLLMDNPMGAQEFFEAKAQDISYALFTKFGFLIELASLILLAGLIGAFHLGSKHKK